MIPGTIKSRTCLLPMVTPETHTFLRLYRHYDSGYLPLSGGLMEQPNNYLEAMEKLGEQFGKLRGEIMEQERKKAERGR